MSLSDYALLIYAQQLSTNCDVFEHDANWDMRMIEANIGSSTSTATTVIVDPFAANDQVLGEAELWDDEGAGDDASASSEA